MAAAVCGRREGTGGGGDELLSSTAALIEERLAALAVIFPGTKICIIINPDGDTLCAYAGDMGWCVRVPSFQLMHRPPLRQGQVEHRGGEV